MTKPRRNVSLPGLMTVARASQILDCSSKTIYRLHREGKLDLVKIGDRGTRVTEASLDKLLKEISGTPVTTVTR